MTSSADRWVIAVSGGSDSMAAFAADCRAGSRRLGLGIVRGLILIMARVGKLALNRCRIRARACRDLEFAL